MNLKSSIEFGKLLKDKSDSEYRKIREYYDAFLERKLSLGMFTPCDIEGNILEEPDPTNWQNFTDDGRYRDVKYQEAKERVLFKGFEVQKTTFKNQLYVKLGDIVNSIYPFPNTRGYRIEDLAWLNVELTESALKEIGIKK